MEFDREKMIIVTGGAGFIGSATIRHLNDLGHTNIVVVDELGSDEKWRNLVGKQFAEILSPSELLSWLQGRHKEVGAFIHLGACSSTVESDASFLLENNYRYTQRLCEYAIEHDIRFIYASSAATYGDGSNGFSDDHDQLETLQPLNMYGYSKHLFDLWAKRQGLLDTIVGLKYFNVFGPNETHKGRMASALTFLLPQAQEMEKVRLFASSDPENFTDGGQQRDFIYVKDAVRMTCDFLENDTGGIFNIGTGRAETWNDLANSLFLAIEKPARIEYFAMPEDLVGKYQNYTCADMKKHREHAKLDPTTRPLQEAVKDYVQGYLLEDKRW